MRSPSLGLALASLALLTPAAAWPCSLIPSATTGVLRGEVGPEPLFVSSDDSEQLTDASGQTVPTEVVANPPAPLDRVVNTWNDEPLRILRPLEPLPPGEYSFGFGGRFTVTASAAPPPSEITVRDLRLYLDSGDSGLELGCGGSVDSCGDVSSLVIRLERPVVRPGDGSEPVVGRYVLSARRGADASDDRVMVLSDAFSGGPTEELRFYGGFGDTHFRDAPTCMALQVLLPDGSLGPAADLGCVDPGDDDDPRVERPGGGGGCAGTPAPRRFPTLAAFTLLLAALRLRRRGRGGAWWNG